MIIQESNGQLPRSAYWFITVALIAAGVYLSSIRLLNIEWLTRAGCLIVMLGIWCSVGGIFQERLLVGRIRWRRRNARIRLSARHAEQSTDSEQVAKELAEMNEAFDKLLSEATHELRFSLGVLEVSLLMTGTFLWGFGDIIVG